MYALSAKCPVACVHLFLLNVPTLDKPYVILFYLIISTEKEGPLVKKVINV